MPTLTHPPRFTHTILHACTTHAHAANLMMLTAKGGNYLMNVAPSPLGVWPASALRTFAELTSWMAINGEAGEKIECCSITYHATPDHTRPHQTTPRHTTPHHTTPHHTTALQCNVLHSKGCSQHASCNNANLEYQYTHIHTHAYI